MNLVPSKYELHGPRPLGTNLLQLGLLGLAALIGAAGCRAGQNRGVEESSRRALTPEASASIATGSDPAAVALAESVMDRLGGREAWESTRFVHWKFFGGRRHFWDRLTGDIRIESDGDVFLLNLATRQGSALLEGEVVTAPEALERAWAMWVNDAYWMFLPYKLLDPGVVLRDLGEGRSASGVPGHFLELTFQQVGLTPQNAYRVFVGAESGLVEEWSFWPDAAERAGEPAFTMPWSGWQPFGDIWLATDHGRGADWDIGVPDELASELFTSH